MKPPTTSLHEINEAFSSAAVALTRALGVDPGRINVNGGAVALGHPIGNGARILVTLLHAMKQKDAATAWPRSASVGPPSRSPSSASDPPHSHGPSQTPEEMSQSDSPARSP